MTFDETPTPRAARSQPANGAKSGEAATLIDALLAEQGRLTAVDPKLDDFSYAAETYDAVIISAIAAELSRSTASRWVDSEGSRCAVSLAGWAPAELRQHAPIEVARDAAASLPF